MAQNYNVEINRYNGTDYDGLFPKNAITGTTDPTTSTKGFIGQFYANISTNPAKMWQCVGESGGVYSWKEIIDVDAFSKGETLTPTTAALYGLEASAVPDEVLSAIKTLLDTKAKAVFGSFTTNAAGIATVNLAVQPIAVLIYSENNNWTTIPTGSTGGNISQMIKILTRAFVATGTNVNAITATGFTFSGTAASSVCRYVALI